MERTVTQESFNNEMRLKTLEKNQKKLLGLILFLFIIIIVLIFSLYIVHETHILHNEVLLKQIRDYRFSYNKHIDNTVNYIENLIIFFRNVQDTFIKLRFNTDDLNRPPVIYI